MWLPAGPELLAQSFVLCSAPQTTLGSLLQLLLLRCLRSLLHSLPVSCCCLNPSSSFSSSSLCWSAWRLSFSWLHERLGLDLILCSRKRLPYPSLPLPSPSFASSSPFLYLSSPSFPLALCLLVSLSSSDLLLGTRLPSPRPLSLKLPARLSLLVLDQEWLVCNCSSKPLLLLLASLPWSHVPNRLSILGLCNLSHKGANSLSWRRFPTGTWVSSPTWYLPLLGRRPSLLPAAPVLLACLLGVSLPPSTSLWSSPSSDPGAPLLPLFSSLSLQPPLSLLLLPVSSRLQLFATALSLVQRAWQRHLV